MERSSWSSVVKISEYLKFIFSENLKNGSKVRSRSAVQIPDDDGGHPGRDWNILLQLLHGQSRQDQAGQQEVYRCTKSHLPSKYLGLRCISIVRPFFCRTVGSEGGLWGRQKILSGQQTRVFLVINLYWFGINSQAIEQISCYWYKPIRSYGKIIRPTT